MSDHFTYPTLTGYMSGCNLGHWLSQHGSNGREHWNSYITESDFARIAAWGMDHVRLPMDYMFFESDEMPFQYEETQLAYIDNALAWAGKHGLNVVLDLHHAPGFIYHGGAENNLLTNSESQKRFIAIWEMFARRYQDIGDRLRFELLNELVCTDAEVALWNDLWQRTVAAIHAISSHRCIILGGNYNNHPNEMQYLTYIDDPRIFYTFHVYTPFIFTHQRVNGAHRHPNYTKPVTYPFHFDDHLEYFAYYGNPLPSHFGSMGPGQLIGKAYVEESFAPAIRFIEKHNRPVYLGEYGVVYHADDDSAVRWYNDIADICIRYGIGRAVWSYRGFANITDSDNNIRDYRMVEAVSRQK